MSLILPYPRMGFGFVRRPDGRVESRVDQRHISGPAGALGAMVSILAIDHVSDRV
jgi:hypothetical protein